MYVAKTYKRMQLFIHSQLTCLFFADQMRASLTFFVGGPVWSMAWCPIPDDEVPTANQYAAIYCHRTMDETHRMTHGYQGPGLLQLWNFGILTGRG